MRKIFLGLILASTVLLAACNPWVAGDYIKPIDQSNHEYLECVLWRESKGDYFINTGNGYFGGYQFLPSTWNNVAAHIERWDLYGKLPNEVSPYDQDIMANALVNWVGRNSGSFGGYCG